MVSVSEIDLFPAGDVVEDQLRNVGVVADDDEDWGCDSLGLGVGVLLPELVVLLVVAVQALDGPFELGGKLWFFVELFGLPAFPGKVLADAEPEVAVGGLVALHRVVGDRDAGDFDDAGFDRVDQGEVGDDPGEERSLGVA